MPISIWLYLAICQVSFNAELSFTAHCHLVSVSFVFLFCDDILDDESETEGTEFLCFIRT